MQSVTLIIDKRKELSTKYKKLLAGAGNIVIVTKDLISAMKTIQDKEPDLILISDSIDNDLSDYCKKIRAITYNTRPIIIGMSKSAELEDKLKVLQNGADDFISEPVNPEEFVMRIFAHLRREFESNLNFKKLLPNKNYSMRAIKRILHTNSDWACLLLSIENYESYKENYTELAADKLIQTYVAIINSALNETDYLGEISENEFLIITASLKAEKIANFLTFAFDSVRSKFYSIPDNKRGYIILSGDEVAGRRANFVHTTIGVVTNKFIKYKDANLLLNALVQIHNMADLPTKSNYLMERPKISAQNAVAKDVFNKKILIMEPDDSMTLLLNTILNIQGYEPQTFSDIKNAEKFTPAVVILDAGSADELAGIKKKKKLKAFENYRNTKFIMTSIIHDKELILNSGADLYIPKPYDIATLVKWVETFIREVNL